MTAYAYSDTDDVTEKANIDRAAVERLEGDPYGSIAMTDEEHQTLCKILRTMEPWPCKEAADEIERLNLELRHERDVRAEAERGCVNMAKEIERLAESVTASRGYVDECEERIEFLNDQIDAMFVSPALAQSDADDPGDATWRNLKKRMDMGTEEATAALAQSDARLRCLVTGNPCGTDTWQVGSPCACANCQAWLAQSDADRPLGFRTNDVPNPYAEGPQSDARPLAWHWNSKLEGWTYTSDAGPVAWRYAYPLYPDEWNLTQDQLTAEERMRKESCVVEPLYAGPLTDRSGK